MQTPDLLEEIADLHRDVLRLTSEKERIMQLKVSQAGLSYDQFKELMESTEEPAEEQDSEQPQANLPAAPAAIVFLEEGIRSGGAGMLLLDMLHARHEKLMHNKHADIVAIDDNFVIPTQNESIRRTAGITSNDVLRKIVHLLAGLPQENAENL